MHTSPGLTDRVQDLQDQRFRPSVLRKAALLLAALLPVLTVIAVVAQEARPVPMFDDDPAILRFGLTFSQLQTVPQKLLFLMASQHGQYKLIVEHALLAFDLATTHRIHFGLLLWAGNLLGLGIGCLLWRTYFTSVNDTFRRLLLFLPVAYLFFDLNYAENFD